MAFEEIVTATQMKGTGVSAGLQKRLGNPARLRLNLGIEVLEATGWSMHTSVTALIGTGEDKGKLRLKPGGCLPLTPFKPGKSRKSHFLVSVGPVSGLPDIHAKASPCGWEAVRGMHVDILLPKAWFAARTEVRAPVASQLSGPDGPRETELQRQHRESEERKKRLGLRS